MTNRNVKREKVLKFSRFALEHHTHTHTDTRERRTDRLERSFQTETSENSSGTDCERIELSLHTTLLRGRETLVGDSSIVRSVCFFECLKIHISNTHTHTHTDTKRKRTRRRKRRGIAPAAAAAVEKRHL